MHPVHHVHPRASSHVHGTGMACVQVLSGMSFEVAAGSVCALVGKSGGGKSTMIHLLLRFYDPHEGCVRVGGVDLKRLHLPSVHERIGVVSQETQLFNSTIAENIAYGAGEQQSHARTHTAHRSQRILCAAHHSGGAARCACATGEHTHEELLTATRAAQAYDFIHSFEDGLATRVGERGQRLSGGQKQRIAIARCLLRKPRLLLLDEATSALDAESEAAVQKALDEMIWQTGGYTVLLVAHRLSTVVNSHQIVVVDQGRAAEVGDHATLLAKQGAYAGLVAHQIQKQKEQLSESETAGAAASAAGAGTGSGRGGRR